MVQRVYFFLLLYLIFFINQSIQNLLSNLKLVTKSTGAIICLIILNGFSLFLMFLGSNIPFFFNYQIAASFVYNRTILEKLNFSINNGKRRAI